MIIRSNAENERLTNFVIVAFEPLIAHQKALE